MLFLSFLLLLPFLSPLPISTNSFTDPEFTSLITSLDSLLLSGPNLARALRLSFHDCIDGCNGCINGLNPDNAKLKLFILELENLIIQYEFKSFYGKYMTRADFWALSGMRAAYLSSNYTGLTPVSVNFKVGRMNCKNGLLRDDLEDLPSGIKGYDHVIEVMSRFNLTKREIVALMGVHSVGEAKDTTSGMQGWWSATNRVLDNAFFRNMLNSELAYKQIPINVTGFQTKYQWNATADWCVKDRRTNQCRPNLSVQNKRFMMNSDMCLHLNFTVDASGKAGCDYSTCPINSETNVYVEEFAKSEPEFKKVFGEAFEKMVEYGYSGASALRDL